MSSSEQAGRVWDALRARPEVLAGVLELIDQESRSVATGWQAAGESWERRVWGKWTRMAHVFHERGTGKWFWRVGNTIREGRLGSLEEARAAADRVLIGSGWLLLP